jgi:hypothetical protein
MTDAVLQTAKNLKKSGNYPVTHDLPIFIRAIFC